MLKLLAVSLVVALAAASAAVVVEPDPAGNAGYPAPAVEAPPAVDAYPTATPEPMVTAGPTPTHLIPTLNAMWTVTAHARRFPSETPLPEGYPAP